MNITDPFILHARLIKLSSRDPSLYNNLITLYSKNPATFTQSLRLFNHLPFNPTRVSWTSVISAHTHHSPLISLHLFLSMLRSHSLPNQGTVSSLLKAFSSSLTFGLQLHSLSFKLSLTALPFSGSALVHFYAVSSLPSDALKVFGEITHRDEVCYSATIVGLAQNDQPLDALTLFKAMRADGTLTSMYSLSGALRASAQLAAVEQTRAIHSHAVVAGIDANVAVGTALVDAYGKSGAVSDARRAFDGIVTGHNLVAWNAMLSAYAQQGDADSAIQLFDELTERELFGPDKLSLLAVLSACSNGGLVEETSRRLESMRLTYQVEPALEHYTCLVGALARDGRVDEAELFARTMPIEPDDAVWRAVLSGCAVHGSVQIAQAVSQRLVDMNPRDDSAYVMLANVYSAAGMKDETVEVWERMRRRAMRKERGRSWVEVEGGSA